jgi:hypothetical protein
MNRHFQQLLRPDTRALRQFGFIALVGFGFLAVIAWFELLIFSGGLGGARLPVSAVLAGVAVSAGMLSLTAPRGNLTLYLVMTVISYPIGIVVSFVVMAILFFGLLAPVGLFFRVTGRDALNRRLEPSGDTYWKLPRPRRDRESYFRQF